MKTGSIFSRRKIWSNVRLTDVVPAPEEPVIAMMGCLIDIVSKSGLNRSTTEQAAPGEQRRRRGVAPLSVIAGDALDLVLRAEDQRRSCVEGSGRLVQDAMKPIDRRAARLFDEEGDRSGFIKHAQA